eukprot:7909786-Lingulodinium_polyedra.AAC.1
MLEAVWGRKGGPRCPLIAAESSAIAAHLAGRSCGPEPTRRRAHAACRELLAFATVAAEGGDRTPECKDAATVMLRL